MVRHSLISYGLPVTIFKAFISFFILYTQIKDFSVTYKISLQYGYFLIRLNLSKINATRAMNYPEYLRLVIIARLRQHKGDLIKVAYSMNMARRTLVRHIKNLDIDDSEYTKVIRKSKKDSEGFLDE